MERHDLDPNGFNLNSHGFPQYPTQAAQRYDLDTPVMRHTPLSCALLHTTLGLTTTSISALPRSRSVVVLVVTPAAE